MTTVHLDLLDLLRSADGYGLPIDRLLFDLRRGRHPQLTQPQLERALRDLADKSLVALEEAMLGPRWRITSGGRFALTEARA